MESMAGMLSGPFRKHERNRTMDNILPIIIPSPYPFSLPLLPTPSPYPFSSFVRGISPICLLASETYTKLFPG